MEESLKAARTIHQIIVIASTAMLIFAMSARAPENQFTIAQDELQRMEEAFNHVPVLFLDPNELRRFYGEKDGFDELMEGQSARPSFLTLYRTGTLSEIWSAISKLRYDPFLPRNIGRSANPTLPAHYTCDAVPHFGPHSVSVRVICATPSKPVTVAVTELRRRMYLRDSLIEANLRIYRLVVFRDPGRPDLDREALPALRAVWDTVKDLDTASAAATLDRLARESARASSPKLSVLGLEMQAPTAIVAGPAILIALLLYLYAHLLHIQAIAPGCDATLRTFPWLPLFGSRLSLGLTASTLLVLPSVAAVWTVWVAGLSRNHTVALAAGYVAGIGIAAFASIRKVRELKRLCDMELPAATPAPAAATMDRSGLPDHQPGL